MLQVFFFFTLLLSSTAFSTHVLAADFYVSPTGSGATCSYSSPCALGRLTSASEPRPSAGENWILKNGTYANVALFFNCAAGTSLSGTAGSPIVLRAESERQAFLRGHGGAHAITMSGCRHWNIEGLRVENVDNPASTAGNLISIFDPCQNNNSCTANSSTAPGNIKIRRNLLLHPNRYANTSAISISAGSDFLIEENEVYFFHRNAMQCFGTFTSRCTFRRNYIDQRDGRSTCPPKPANRTDSWCDSDPSDSIIMYSSHHNVLENNISVVNSHGTIGNSGTDNRYLGNVTMGTIENGFTVNKHPGEYVPDIVNNLYENNVVLNPTYHGFSVRSVESVTLRNNSVFASGNNQGNGLNADNLGHTENPSDCSSYHPCFYDQTPEVYVENNLFQGTNGAVSFSMLYANSSKNYWERRKIEHTVGWSNPGGAWKSGTSGTNRDGSAVRDLSTTPPAGVSSISDLGACRMWIPATSSLKGKGKGGQDIGANVLYRYHDGVLTSQPLWDPSTGEFPHGAIISGVNDRSGISVFDVHKRLNVGAAHGCAFPAGYASGGTGGGSAAIPVPTDGLIGYWPLDEISSPSTDASNSGATGVWVNAPSPGNGKIHGALVFNGVDNYVHVPSASSTVSGITVAGWVRSDAISDLDTIYALGNQSGTAGFHWLYLTPGSLNWQYANGSTYQVRSANMDTTAGVWRHVALVHDYANKQIRFFVDGVSVAAYTHADPVLAVSGKAAAIGAYVSVKHYLGGAIDELRVYKRPLSAAEVTAVFRDEGLAPGSFDFTLSNTGNMSLSQGQSGSVGISAGLATGAPQAVTFSVSGVPSGVTATLSQSSCTVACVNTLHLAVSPAAAPGTASITVSATSGAVARATSMSVTVVPVSTTPFLARDLGQTGEDKVGMLNQTSANGSADQHIRVSGLKGVPVNIRITSNTGGIWEWPFNGANWIIGSVYDGAGAGDFWFEPYPSSSFVVTVTYATGSVDQASATPTALPPVTPPPVIPPVTPTVFKASYLGQTGEDKVGEGNQTSGNGRIDNYIQVNGLKGTPIKVRVTSDTGGIWEWPYNGVNWIVGQSYDGSGNGDFWIEPYSSNSYTVSVVYATGATDQAAAANQVPPVSNPVFSAQNVTMAGEDKVGPQNITLPNGRDDFHLRVTGLIGVPAKITIASDTGGVWELPYNGYNWTIATQYDGQGQGDFWFEPYNSNRFTVTVRYSDGTTKSATTP